jgi:hypothetical protein
MSEISAGWDFGGFDGFQRMTVRCMGEDYRIIG